MDHCQKFENVFGIQNDTDYPEHIVDDIVRNRRKLEDNLFVDRLLKALGVEDAPKLYPPHSGAELRKLHERIVSSASPDHHKHALLYYVRKEFPNTSRQAAENYARASYLPESYRIFVDGIWYLDHLKFERALDYLTEPALIPTYPEEILYILCHHAPKNDCSLPLAYYYTVSPCITSNKALEALFFVLCRSSISEAFFFSRGQGETVHHDLFEKLVGFVLKSSKGESRAMRGFVLISLPLNDIEEAWFYEYLRNGDGKTLPGATDTIIMRRLVKEDTNLLLEHQETLASNKIDGINWLTLKESLRTS